MHEIREFPGMLLPVFFRNFFAYFHGEKLSLQDIDVQGVLSCLSMSSEKGEKKASVFRSKKRRFFFRLERTTQEL